MDKTNMAFSRVTAGLATDTYWPLLAGSFLKAYKISLGIFRKKAVLNLLGIAKNGPIFKISNITG